MCSFGYTSPTWLGWKPQQKGRGNILGTRVSLHMTVGVPQPDMVIFPTIATGARDACARSRGKAPQASHNKKKVISKTCPQSKFVCREASIAGYHGWQLPPPQNKPSQASSVPFVSTRVKVRRAFVCVDPKCCSESGNSRFPQLDKAFVRRACVRSATSTLRYRLV